MTKTDQKLARANLSVVVTIGGVPDLIGKLDAQRAELRAVWPRHETILVVSEPSQADAEALAQWAVENERVRITRADGGHLGQTLSAGWALAQEPLVLLLTPVCVLGRALLDEFRRHVDEVDVITVPRAVDARPSGGTLGQWIAGYLQRKVFAVWPQDPLSPVKLLHRETTDKLVLQSAGPFAYVELLAKANVLEQGIGEAETAVKMNGAPDQVTLPELWSDMVAVFRRPVFRKPAVVISEQTVQSQGRVESAHDEESAVDAPLDEE